MKSPVRLANYLLLSFALIFFFFLSGCGNGSGSSGSKITVALSQSGSATTLSAGGSAVTLTATVANDTSNGGVTWSLSPSAGCGSLTSSGTTATYTPPTEASLDADCTATITSASVTNSSKTTTMAFSIKAIAITLPAGENTTQMTTASGASLTLSASIANDGSGSASLQWTITGSGTSSVRSARPRSQNPLAVQNSTCGSLSDSSGNSVTYTPPANVGCTATVTVSTSANSNVKRIFTITVNPPLTVSTSAALAAGTVGAGYTTTLAATGGVSPYTWTLGSGTLPPGITLTSGGLLSGMPTTAGTYGFTVALRDSYSPADTAQQTFSVTINKAVLTVTGLSAQSKVYDGATTATLSGTGTLAGVVNGDTVTLGGTPVGAFASAAVGTGKTVNVSGLSLSGSGAGNYTLTQPAGLTADITAKALTVTGLLAQSKAYDGATAATLSGTGTLVGVVTGDTVTLSGTPAGTFASAVVGTGKTVNVSGLSLSGGGAGNYTLTQPAGLTAEITAKALTVTGLSAQSKVYDGATAATLGGSGSLVGVVSGDTGNVALVQTGYTAAFASKNVANGVAVTVSNLTLGGSAAGNYTLTQPAGLTADITAKALTVTGLSAQSKVYDGATTATLSGTGTLAGVVNGDTVTLSGTPVGAFASAAVGTGKTVNVSGLSLSGSGAGNYTLTQPAGLTAEITAKALTVTGLSAQSKVYDGATTATLSGTGTLVGVVTGDTVTLSGTPAGTFASAGVGTGKTVNVSGLSLSGGGAGNYTLTQPAGLTADITSKTLTITGLTAQSKVYDGTTAATLGGTGALVGVASGDSSNVTLIQTGYTATFASKNVANGVAVTVSNLTLGGSAAVNYTLTQPTGLAANITPVPLTVTAAAKGKTYGTTDPALTYAITSGALVGADSLTGSLTRAAGESVGTYAIQQGTLAAGGNYNLTYVGANLTIGTAPLTVTGLSAQSKVYDGATAATLSGTGALVGVVSGDAGNVTLIQAGYTATFASKNVANGIAVAVSNLTLSGSAAGNYALTQPTGLTANITAKALTVTGLSAQNKMYDGTTAATLGGTGALVGVVSGETGNVTLIQTGYTATFASKNVANGIAVTVSNLTLGGSAAGNYTLTQPTGLAANITPAALTVTAAAKSKTYGTADPALTYTITSGALVGADTLTGSPTRAAGELVGTYAIQQGTLVAGGNYNLTYVGANLTITTAPVTVTGLAANNKVYDGTNTATLNFGGAALTGVLAADTGNVTLVQTGYTATFASTNAGIGATVNISGLTLSGTAASNYTLTNSITTTTAAITARPLHVTATASSKAYDGTTSATAVVTLQDDRIAGDNLTFSSNATFADKNVGAGKAVSITSIAISGGASQANYALANTTTSTTASITARAITVTAVATSKTYDGTVSSSGVPTISPALVGADTATFTQSYDNKNAGTGKTLAPAGAVNDGNGGGNYNVTLTSVSTGVITAAPLTVTAAAKNKIYGTIDPALTYTITNGALVGSDSLTGNLTRVAGEGVGAYAIQQGTLAADSNYSLTYVGANLTISTAQLNVTGLAVNSKVYDGTTAASLNFSGASLNGVVGSDDVTLNPAGSAAAFVSKNVANGISVSISNLPLSGSAASNYALTQPFGLTANITAAALSVTADNKTMNQGGSVPTLTASYSGFVNGENAGIALIGTPGLSTTATSSSPAGTYPITATQGSLLAANYSFSFQSGTMTVTALPISVSITQAQGSIPQLGEGGSVVLSATINDDVGGQGISWGSLDGCGMFNPHTGNSVTFTANTNLGATPCTTTVMAASAADPTKNDTRVITVNPITVGIAPLSPPSIHSGSQQDFTATVNNDGANQGVNWSITSPLDGSCGNMGSSTNASLTFLAPSPLASNCSATITATSRTNAAKSSSVTVQVVAVHNVSGTIRLQNSGTGLQGITVSINTTPTQTVTTDATGNFALNNVPDGDYTVTPSISGPSSVFYPATQNVTVSGADANLDFQGQLGYTVSGSVSYGGSATGRVYLQLQATNNNCITPGTSIAAPGSFTIHGVCPGTYTLKAWMDNVGQGAANASNPAGSSSGVTVSTTDYTGASVTLADPAPVDLSSKTVAWQTVSPTSDGVVATFNPVADSNGREAATSYVIQWSPSNTFAPTLYEQSFAAMGGKGAPYILSGTNGLAGLSGALYFRIRGVNASSHTPWTVTPSAITIAAPTGNNTVSGNVNFSGTPTGPMFAGCYDQNSGNIYSAVIPNPTSPQQPYTVSGIPNGANCFMFGIIDQNKDGVIGAGDINNTNESSSLPVTGNTTQDITLPSANATASLTTLHSRGTDSNGDQYAFNVDLQGVIKLPVALELTSGSNVLWPVDVAKDPNSTDFHFWSSIGSSALNVGDTYDLSVTYSDATSETLHAVVAGILDAFATNLQVAYINPTSVHFTWAPPANPPASYAYSFRISDNFGNQLWQVPGNNSRSYGLDSSRTFLDWGFDPTDSNNVPSSLGLNPGTYYWSITVTDISTGNSALIQVTYQTP